MPDGARSGPDRGFTLRSRVRDRSLEVALGGELDMAAAFKLEPALNSSWPPATSGPWCSTSAMWRPSIRRARSHPRHSRAHGPGRHRHRDHATAHPVRRLLLDLTGNGELLGG